MRNFLAVFLFFSAVWSAASGAWMVCYFSSWAVYRPGIGAFDVDNVDPSLCTHAVFGFAGLSNQTWTIEVLDPWNENCVDDIPSGNNCAYQRFVALKQQNPALKTLLSVGGWNEGSVDYSVMVGDPAKRATFIQSTIQLLEKEGFDGLDMDWEYPGQRGGVEADKANFITLLDEFRAEFDQRGLLLASALANGNPHDISTSYDVAGLVRNLDIMSIMTYDFHGAWENTTHHNSPLCAYPSDEGEFIYFNVAASIDYWIEMGADPAKMVMGVALYGRCFTLDDISQHGMLASATEPGEPGPYTRLPGTQGWNEICVRIEDSSDCTVVNDPLLHEPYMYCAKDNLWCGYEDLASAKLKAQFAKSKGLAGLVFWTIDTDDFYPTCGSQKFSMINTAKGVFDDPTPIDPIECGNIPTVTTEQPTDPPPSTTVPVETTTGPVGTTTDPVVTTTDGGGGPTTTSIPVYPTKPDCSLDTGTYHYPHSDCNKFWWCVSGEPILMLCSPGTYYDPETEICDFPENVDTSNCIVWVCESDGVTFAGAECNEYYECEHGQPIQKFCAPPLYYNPEISMCDYPENVNTDSCNTVGGLRELLTQ